MRAQAKGPDSTHWLLNLLVDNDSTSVQMSESIVDLFTIFAVLAYARLLGVGVDLTNTIIDIDWCTFLIVDGWQ